MCGEYNHLYLNHQICRTFHIHQVPEITYLNPNPNNGHFRIEIAQEQVGSTYRIIDFSGRTIETGTITKPSQDFDLSDKPKGLYRVQVSNEKASKTLNVVIQ
jgi:hypothetical protein